MADIHEAALRFEKVRFSYGSVPVLENASFHVHPGEFVALVGPNGAGKTTVLRLLLGLSEPGAGKIEVLGKTPKAARDAIGYVPQHASYDPAFPISVREVVRMGRLKSASRRFGADDERAVRAAMEAADVADLSGRPYSALSGGQRRRVLVARALAAEPRLLVLDEPTANMDADSESRLFAALGALKGRTTILIVTHDTGFVSRLTDVVLCVGERAGSGGGRGIVRHRAAPAENAPPQLFGGAALKVLHERAESGDACKSGACSSDDCADGDSRGPGAEGNNA